MYRDKYLYNRANNLINLNGGINMESIKKVIVVCIIIYLISEIISAISLFILSKRDDKMGELSRQFIKNVKLKMNQLYKR